MAVCTYVRSFRLGPILDQMSQKIPCITVVSNAGFAEIQEKNVVLNCPTTIDIVFLVVVTSDTDNSYRRFFSGFLFNICEIYPQ